MESNTEPERRMASIVHILLLLTIAILRAFAQAFLMIFSTALTAILAFVALTIVILLLTGTLSLSMLRRK
jgi:hypothetical protein